MRIFDTAFDPTHDAALVTGAGNGIGKAIAQALVGEGVRTVFADISEQRVASAIDTAPRRELAVPWIGDLCAAGCVRGAARRGGSGCWPGDAFCALGFAAAPRGRPRLRGER